MVLSCCLEGPLVALGLRSADHVLLDISFPDGFEDSRNRQASQERSRVEARQSKRAAGELRCHLRFCESPVKVIANEETFNPEVPRRVAAPLDTIQNNGNSCVEENYDGRRAYHEQVNEDEDFLFPLLDGYRAASHFDRNVDGTRVRWHNRYECHMHPLCSSSIPEEERDEAFADGRLFSLNAGNIGYCAQGYGRPCRGSEADMSMWTYNWQVDVANKIQKELKVLPNPIGSPKSAYTRNPAAPYCDPQDPYWETQSFKEGASAVSRQTSEEVGGCCRVGTGLVMLLSGALEEGKNFSDGADSELDSIIREAADYGSMI